MKTFILVATLLTCMFTARAQIDSGGVGIGVTALYHRYVYNPALLNQIAGNTYLFSNLHVLVTAEFIVGHNATLGFTVGYDHVTYKQEDTSSYYKYNSATKYGGVPFGVYYRRWFPIKQLNNRVVFTTDAQLMGEAMIRTIGAPSSSSVEQIAIFNPQIVPGIALFLNNHLSIHCFAGGAGYSVTVTKPTYINATSDRQTVEHLYAHFSPDSWSLGFNYIFTTGMKMPKQSISY